MKSDALRSWAEIDLAALAHNYKVIQKNLAPGSSILGVIKADAYGHGMIPVAKTLAKEGIQRFGVASVAEAIPLRNAGLKQTILLLSAALPAEYPEAIEHRLTFTISSLEEAKNIAKLARRMKKRALVHLKINTGMNRLGAWHQSGEALASYLQKSPELQWTGLCTHFASADEDRAFTQEQWKRFLPWAKRFPGLLLHAANSAGMLQSKSYHLHAVRPGISLYGYPPIHQHLHSFRPILSWKSRITRIETVPAGQTISYGATYRTPKCQRLATLSVGYADGYSRLLSNQGSVLLHQQRAPIRGRVTMDQIIVDITRISNALVGDAATLIGREGTHSITAEDLARQTETIPYEILSGIRGRVVRVFTR